MDSKKIRKSIGRFIGWIGFNICYFILNIIPERNIYWFAKKIGALAYMIARKQKRIALESLSIAFGKEKTLQGMQQIAKDCFAAIAKSGVEVLFLMDKPELLKKRIEITGKENLDKALSSSKGIILISAHFGNFPLLLARLSLEGYKTAGIMRFMRDWRMEKIFAEKRRRYNIKTIYSQPRTVCVSQTMQALRDNELVFIPLDQNFGTGGVFVDFFGQKAATATGPVILARRTGAALLPCFIVRQKNDTHKIIVEPQLELITGKDNQETIFINIQRLTQIIESYIKQYPEQWGWIHRRWKSRPS